MTALSVLAGKELKDSLRNRWLMASTLVFAGLALAITLFGGAASGSVGITPLPATLASLASLATFLVPLMALMLGYDAIVGEEEQGTLLLLLAYPLSRPALLLGKFAGHALLLALAMAMGFGLAAVTFMVFGDMAPGEVLLAFARFTGASILLGWSCLALGYLVSTLASEKSTAAGLALAVWFVMVLLFDLVLLAVLVATEGHFLSDSLPWLLMANPTDVYRLLSLGDAQGALTGVLSLGAGLPGGTAGLWLALGTWTAVPLGAALWRFCKRPL
ncbi:ABC transporter permease [Hahella sp. SMD15-11]|uniref:ABC transporter permease n=1 Tax=Thermohahella caldifontis TaxID=3142973 RepID=A0AB39US45_9GAMM